MNEPPYQPFYKPYGMSDEQYIYECELAKQKLAEWEQEQTEEQHMPDRLSIEERLKEKSLFYHKNIGFRQVIILDEELFNPKDVYIPYSDALQICNEAIAERENKWIGIKEKTPGFNIRVLGLTNKGGIYITFEDAFGELDDYSISTIPAERGEEYFVAWQPLPELPKEY